MNELGVDDRGAAGNARASTRSGIGPLIAVSAKETDLAAFLEDLQAISIELWLVKPAVAGGHALGHDGIAWEDERKGRCGAIMERIRHRTSAVGKPAQGKLHATFPEVFKRAAALEPGEFFPLGPHEVRELLLWKAGGDFRRGRLEVNAEFERLDCVFRFDREEGRYGVRKLRTEAAPVLAPPPSVPPPLVSETSVPTAEHLIELIAAGDSAKEEIVEACRRWVKLRASKP